MLFNLTLISSAVWYGETELGFTCALTPDCQRLHARPPDFPEFSLSTWVRRRRRVRAKDTDRIRRRPFHFRFGRGSHDGLLCLCLRAPLGPTNSRGWQRQRKISLFTVFLRVPHLHDDDSPNWDGAAWLAGNLTSARCLSDHFNKPLQQQSHMIPRTPVVVVKCAGKIRFSSTTFGGY